MKTAAARTPDEKDSDYKTLNRINDALDSLMQNNPGDGLIVRDVTALMNYKLEIDGITANSDLSRDEETLIANARIKMGVLARKVMPSDDEYSRERRR
jgi:hypothetical protein